MAKSWRRFWRRSRYCPADIKKQPGRPARLFLCRGGRTRTGDLFDPNEARYQTAPHPEQNGLYALPGRGANAV